MDEGEPSVSLSLVETLGAVATTLAVAGVILNNHRLRFCFVLWIVSNAMSLAIHLDAGIWSLAARDGAFWLLAIHGLWRWGRETQ